MFKFGLRANRPDMKPQTLRTPSELAAAGLIAPSRIPALDAVAARYAVAISPDIAALLGHNAIARQFLPSEAELVTTPEERADPIGDAAHSPVSGIVHRHPDRVLFKAVATCPVCRRKRWMPPSPISSPIRKSGK